MQLIVLKLPDGNSKKKKEKNNNNNNNNYFPGNCGNVEKSREPNFSENYSMVGEFKQKNYNRFLFSFLFFSFE